MMTEELYTLFQKHPVISTDSRQIPQGALFFALKGEHFDGNEFAAYALEKGASYAIIDDSRFLVNDRCVMVENVLISLQQLAHYHRKQFHVPVLAITGTNGKTTTKELTCAILSKKFKVIATAGNQNNHIGVPITLLNINTETEIVIVEMGANHGGEIDALCRIAEPTHGIITNIGKAHLEGFGSFEGVVNAKTELYRFLIEKTGIAFINTANHLLVDHAKGLKFIGYDPGKINYPEAEHPETPCLSMEFSIHGQVMALSTKLFGRYNAENILAAICIGNYFGVKNSQIKEAVESYTPQNNRSQVLQTESNFLILDMYNANPSSMEPALINFSGSSHNRKVLILGDMLELGIESDAEHLHIMEMLEKLDFKEVFLVGPEFTRLNTKREWLCFQDVELAHLWLDHHRVMEAAILLKGSRGIKLENLMDLL